MSSLVKYTAVLLLLAASQTAFAKIIYVKTATDGGNDSAVGDTSWTNAYATAGKALSVAAVLLETEPNVEIWIAKGTYVLASPLTMMNDVGIFGGFAGIDGEGKEDRVAANETILDGAGRRRVFYNAFTSEARLTDSAVLDSVTIANGHAAGGDGGGMHNYYASPKIVNCTFSGNRAVWQYAVGFGGGNGGGMYNRVSSPAVSDCTFSGNTAHAGGGVYNYSSSSSKISRCTFSGNTANAGGGIYNSASTPGIDDCTFSKNHAYSEGGAIYNHRLSSLTSTFRITNCTFSENQSGYDGGGMSNNGGAPSILGNCTFSGNKAGRDGGGLFSNSAKQTIVNCTFSGNQAKEDGGGMCIYFNSSNFSTVITNCIVWGNTPKVQIFAVGPQVTYSIVQGGYEGTGNKNADPLLMALGNYGGLVPTMPVREGSPARNSGTSGTSISLEDAIGQMRTFPCTLGAVEFNETLAAIVIKEGIARFLPDYKFTLEVYAASAASYQWYKDGEPIEGATKSTYSTAQLEPTATYHCVVALSGGGTQTTASVKITTGFTMRPAFSVYETKVSAKTSVIKHTSVKIECRTSASEPWKPKSVPVHYRAPVTKRYTILMAYDGNGDAVYQNTASGRMWASDKQYRFEFRGESRLQKGRTDDGRLGLIGSKGRNIPEEECYYIASDPTAPVIYLTGLATLDWNNGGRVASSTGIVCGVNFAPSICTTHEAEDQGLEEDWEWNYDEWTPKSIYYPQPCLVEGDDPEELTKAHFHGTYTTRYNATKSKALNWSTVESQMDDKWVPKANREKEEKDDVDDDDDDD